MDKTTAQALIIAHMMEGKDFAFQQIGAALAARDPMMFCELAGLGQAVTWADEAVAHLKRNEIVPAIKSVRTATAMGLKEAKDVVDYFRNVEHCVSWYSMSVHQHAAVDALRAAHGKDVL